jgi:hypothetical protein
MKRCSRCHVEKEETEFHRRRGTSLQPWCKPCQREYTRERNEVTRREEYLAQKQAYVITRHGITVEQYQELLERQEGLCACCGGLPEPGTRLHIDHDHACCPGKTSCGRCVRGLLCVRCNKGLGQFRDDIARLEAAIEYLRSVSAEFSPQ